MTESTVERPKGKKVKCACGCGARFIQNRSWQIYATPQCRTRKWIERHYGPAEINRLKARIRELESQRDALRKVLNKLDPKPTS